VFWPLFLLFFGVWPVLGDGNVKTGKRGNRLVFMQLSIHVLISIKLVIGTQLLILNHLVVN